MKDCNTGRLGFTLIELLVVVLIVGILAAVALAQYQKAVQKSRSMQALTLLKTIGEEMDLYYGVNGITPHSLDELDVDLPADWTGTTHFYTGYGARSNSMWAVSFEDQGNESGKAKAIHVGQINGKYKGAGFSYYISAHGAIPPHQVVCTEVIGSFKLNEGDFCVKIFKGSQVHNSGVRIYTIE